MAASIKRMVELAEEIRSIAAAWKPVDPVTDRPSAVAAIEGYALLPQVVGPIADAFRVMHQTAQESYPFRPVVTNLVEAAAQAQGAVVAAAELIAPTARAAHRQDIEDLGDPRKAMWDYEANRGQAA